MTSISGTAIVIDDDFRIVDLLSEFLELEGIKIVGKGYDGKDAVELYQKFKPDYVFLDVMMPRFDGFYGLKNIKNIDPKAKVIMITADLTKKTADRLEKSWAQYVYKPYEFEEILRVMKNFHSSHITLG